MTGSTFPEVMLALMILTAGVLPLIQTKLVIAREIRLQEESALRRFAERSLHELGAGRP
ncbi:hypothetical protein [Paludibacterium paludis]|uniref:Uncharacterized protein n=1 Tax=Paludibacterium paludis TaxID=1225769 RepID=A0A918P3G4_9NEIS|nr:hypothetical protein [Paludibacterium paludis]GGY16782.1 hypothetical protein GCM10011289_20240 [Paludibacterium paludis]